MPNDAAHHFDVDDVIWWMLSLCLSETVKVGDAGIQKNVARPISAPDFERERGQRVSEREGEKSSEWIKDYLSFPAESSDSEKRMKKLAIIIAHCLLTVASGQLVEGLFCGTGFFNFY